MGKASGVTVSERVAELIIEEWQAGRRTEADKRLLAVQFHTSVSTIGRILDHWWETGVARKPRQGQGKRSDRRWVFAGADAATNLLQLERAYGAGASDDFVSDIRARYLDSRGGGKPALTTVATALRVKLDYTSKGLSKRARERDGPRCDRWIARMNRTYKARQLVCIDETCVPPSLSVMHALGTHTLPRRPRSLPVLCAGMRTTALQIAEGDAPSEGSVHMASSSSIVAPAIQHLESSAC